MRILVTDLGAVADGVTLNTSAIQKAIDDGAAAGGATIVVPRGTFVTGALQLRSRITLEIEQGAVLLGSPNLADYPLVPFVHNEFKDTRSLLWAMGETDIRLRGGGAIDFNHPAFMEMDTPDTRGPDGDKIPFYNERQRGETTIVAKPRPSQPVFIHDCRRVAVEDLLLRRSPCWTLTFSCCDDVKVRGITVDNHLRVPNCDGVHLTATRNALVTGCVFRCADDCVAIGSITNWDRPSENIVVSDCTMISRSSAVRIGHLASKVRNVILSNLIVSDGNRGLGIFAGDGGWVENVQATNLIIHTRLFAGFWWGNGEPLVISAADSTGRIENVRVTRVSAFSESGIVVVGRDGNVKNITLRDWDMQISHGDSRPLLGRWVDLQPAECRPLQEGFAPWLYASDVNGFRIHDVHPRRDPADTAMLVMEPVTEKIV